MNLPSINWKDFALMYPICFIWMFPVAMLSMAIALPNLLFGFLLFIAPLTFYSWRNKLAMKEMAVLSFIFGAGVVFLTAIFILVFGFLFSFFSPFSEPDSTFSNIGLFGVATGSLIIGMTSVIVGLPIWLLVTKFIHEKKKK